MSVGFLRLFLQNLANLEVVRSNVTASQGKTEGLEGPLDEVERSNDLSGRSWADVIGSVASLVDALACLIFLVLPATPASGARLCVLLLLDPITCVIGYWAMYRRLMIERPKLSELGFYLAISGILFLVPKIKGDCTARKPENRAGIILRCSLTRRVDRFWAFRGTCRVLKGSRNSALGNGERPKGFCAARLSALSR